MARLKDCTLLSREAYAKAFREQNPEATEEQVDLGFELLKLRYDALVQMEQASSFVVESLRGIEGMAEEGKVVKDTANINAAKKLANEIEKLSDQVIAIVTDIANPEKEEVRSQLLAQLESTQDELTNLIGRGESLLRREEARVHAQASIDAIIEVYTNDPKFKKETKKAQRKAIRQALGGMLGAFASTREGKRVARMLADQAQTTKGTSAKKVASAIDFIESINDELVKGAMYDSLIKKVDELEARLNVGVGEEMGDLVGFRSIPLEQAYKKALGRLKAERKRAERAEDRAQQTKQKAEEKLGATKEREARRRQELKDRLDKRFEDYKDSLQSYRQRVMDAIAKIEKVDKSLYPATVREALNLAKKAANVRTASQAATAVAALERLDRRIKDAIVARNISKAQEGLSYIKQQSQEFQDGLAKKFAGESGEGMSFLGNLFLYGRAAASDAKKNPYSAAFARAFANLGVALEDAKTKPTQKQREQAIDSAIGEFAALELEVIIEQEDGSFEIEKMPIDNLFKTAHKQRAIRKKRQAFNRFREMNLDEDYQVIAAVRFAKDLSAMVGKQMPDRSIFFAAFEKDIIDAFIESDSYEDFIEVLKDTLDGRQQEKALLEILDNLGDARSQYDNLSQPIRFVNTFEQAYPFAGLPYTQQQYPANQALLDASMDASNIEDYRFEEDPSFIRVSSAIAKELIAFEGMPESLVNAIRARLFPSKQDELEVDHRMALRDVDGEPLVKRIFRNFMPSLDKKETIFSSEYDIETMMDAVSALDPMQTAILFGEDGVFNREEVLSWNESTQDQRRAINSLYRALDAAYLQKKTDEVTGEINKSKRDVGTTQRKLASGVLSTYNGMVGALQALTGILFSAVTPRISPKLQVEGAGVISKNEPLVNNATNLMRKYLEVSLRGSAKIEEAIGLGALKRAYQNAEQFVAQRQRDYKNKADAKRQLKNNTNYRMSIGALLILDQVVDGTIKGMDSRNGQINALASMIHAERDTGNHAKLLASLANLEDLSGDVLAIQSRLDEVSIPKDMTPAAFMRANAAQIYGLSAQEVESDIDFYRSYFKEIENETKKVYSMANDGAQMPINENYFPLMRAGEGVTEIKTDFIERYRIGMEPVAAIFNNTWLKDRTWPTDGKTKYELDPDQVFRVKYPPSVKSAYITPFAMRIGRVVADPSWISKNLGEALIGISNDSTSKASSIIRQALAIQMSAMVDKTIALADPGADRQNMLSYGYEAIKNLFVQIGLGDIFQVGMQATEATMRLVSVSAYATNLNPASMSDGIQTIAKVVSRKRSVDVLTKYFSELNISPDQYISAFAGPIESFSTPESIRNAKQVINEIVNNSEFARAARRGGQKAASKITGVQDFLLESMRVMETHIKAATSIVLLKDSLAKSKNGSFSNVTIVFPENDSDPQEMRVYMEVDGEQVEFTQEEILSAAKNAEIAVQENFGAFQTGGRAGVFMLKPPNVGQRIIRDTLIMFRSVVHQLFNSGIAAVRELVLHSKGSITLTNQEIRYNVLIAASNLIGAQMIWMLMSSYRQQLVIGAGCEILESLGFDCPPRAEDRLDRIEETMEPANMAWLLTLSSLAAGTDALTETALARGISAAAEATNQASIPNVLDRAIATSRGESPVAPFMLRYPQPVPIDVAERAFSAISPVINDNTLFSDSYTGGYMSGAMTFAMLAGAMPSSFVRLTSEVERGLKKDFDMTNIRSTSNALKQNRIKALEEIEEELSRLERETGVSSQEWDFNSEQAKEYIDFVIQKQTELANDMNETIRQKMPSTVAALVMTKLNLSALEEDQLGQERLPIQLKGAGEELQRIAELAKGNNAGMVIADLLRESENQTIKAFSREVGAINVTERAIMEMMRLSSSERKKLLKQLD